MREHDLVAEWTMQPAAQLASTHRGRGLVDHRGERALRSGTERNVQLEIAPCGRIEDERVFARLDVEVANVRQRGFLRVTHVLEQGPAARTTSGRSAQPNPARSRVPSCVARSRAELSRSKCHGGRKRATGPADGRSIPGPH